MWPQARLPVCPQQWDRESALHDEQREDGTIDPINFSLARLGQKVIDAPFRRTSARYFYSTGDNKIRYLGQGDVIESTRTLSYRSSSRKRIKPNWKILKWYEVKHITETAIEVSTFSDSFLFLIVINIIKI